MKILHIGHEKTMNGASKALIELIDEELKNGYEVYVLTKYKSGSFYEELKKRKVKILVKFFINASDRKNIAFRWYIKWVIWHLVYSRINDVTAYELAKIVEKEKIQIVHSNTSVVDIGMRIKDKTEVKHIMHIREFGDLDFIIYPFIGVKKYHNVMNHSTDYFVCISEAIMNHYSDLIKDKKKLVYDGLPFNLYPVFPQKQEHEHINILIAGRITPEKGQADVMRAVIKLLDSNEEYYLYMAGKGRLHVPTKYKDHIIKLGYVDKMQELRSKMDIEVVCSRSEAFGRVTVEGLFSGSIVIASDTGANTEIIKDRKYGYIYKYGDVEDLANKIILATKELNKNLNRSDLQQYVLQEYSIERCAKQMMELFADDSI